VSGDNFGVEYKDVFGKKMWIAALYPRKTQYLKTYSLSKKYWLASSSFKIKEV
jgi:hypothetical protein